MIIIPDPSNFILEVSVVPLPVGLFLRIDLRSFALVVGRRSDRQFLADRLDSLNLSVLIDELDHYLCRRSSSAFAK